MLMKGHGDWCGEEITGEFAFAFRDELKKLDSLEARG